MREDKTFYNKSNLPYLVTQARKLIELTKQGHFFYETVEQSCDWIEKVYLDQAIKDLNLK